MPAESFDHWVAEADTIFQSDIPALSAWQFSSENAASIRLPVLSAVGERSAAFFQEVHRTVNDWFPSAERFVVPDSTHIMLQANPPAIAARLAEFFASHPL